MIGKLGAVELMRGECISLGHTYIMFESNNTGKLIYVNDPQLFKYSPNTIIDLFVIKYDVAGVVASYGFKTELEAKLFVSLNSIPGLSLSTSSKIISNGAETLLKYAASGDLDKFLSLPGVKVVDAEEIIEVLKTKFLQQKEKGGR